MGLVRYLQYRAACPGTYLPLTWAADTWADNRAGLRPDLGTEDEGRDGPCMHFPGQLDQSHTPMCWSQRVVIGLAELRSQLEDPGSDNTNFQLTRLQHIVNCSSSYPPNHQHQHHHHHNYHHNYHCRRSTSPSSLLITASIITTTAIASTSAHHVCAGIL